MKKVVLSIHNPMDYDDEYVEEEGYSGRILEFLNDDGDTETDWQGFLSEAVEYLMFQVNENEDKRKDFDKQWSEKEEIEGSFGETYDQKSEGIDFSKAANGDGPVMNAQEWAEEEGDIEHIRLSCGSGTLRCEIEIPDDEHFDASEAHLYIAGWEFPDDSTSYVITGVVYDGKYCPFNDGEIEPEEEREEWDL